MRILQNENAPPAGTPIEYHIGSAYDNVKVVADNLDDIEAIAKAIEDGTFEGLIYEVDIDTYDELNAIVADAELATEAYVDDAVTGLYEFMGGYNAATNTPDLTTAPNTIKTAQSWQVTEAGTFFGVNVEPGDQLTATINSPALESDWAIVNRNIDSAAFATAAQGATADSALQPGTVDNVSELINDAGYTGDQSAATIAGEYNSVTPIVSQAAAEAGSSVVAERWTPQRVAQAIAALETPPGAPDPSSDPVIVDAATLTLNAGHNGQSLIFINQDCVVTIPDGLATKFQCILGWADGQPTATPNTELVNGTSDPVTPAAAWKKLHLEKITATSWFATF